ncbi:hypothetical protein SEA_EESA_60 [Arthrobacter phage Eesa]|nr:hypothetical protein SEA_EESA_60 [Arthrobacter phage Eesa]
MTELQEGDELRLMMGGEVVGSGVVLPDGNASFQLDSGAVAVFGERLVRGYSIAGEVSGGPSPSVDPVPEPGGGLSVSTEFCHYHGFGDCRTLDCEPLRRPEPVAGRPCGCVPGEECIVCRNRFAFRAEPELLDYLAAAPRPSIAEQNWEAIQDELSVDLRGNPRPGFKRTPYPGDLPVPVKVSTEVRPGVVRIEGNGQRVDIEVEAVLCSTDSHAGTVPAVVFGQFRVPWWEEGRTERAAYCGSCARLLGFMGYFTPEDGAQG